MTLLDIKACKVHPYLCPSLLLSFLPCQNTQQTEYSRQNTQQSESTQQFLKSIHLHEGCHYERVLLFGEHLERDEVASPIRDDVMSLPLGKQFHLLFSYLVQLIRLSDHLDALLLCLNFISIICASCNSLSSTPFSLP